MDQFKLPQGLSFEGNVSENWRRWKQKFEVYMKASGAAGKPEDVKVAILLHCIGDEGLEVYNTFQYAEDENKDLLSVNMTKFERYCTPRKNTLFERYQFSERKQLDGETIDQFATELKIRAQSCEFGAENEKMIRDRVVFGVRDVQLKERLLRGSPDITLEQVLGMCRATEATKIQMKTLKEEEKSVHFVNKSAWKGTPLKVYEKITKRAPLQETKSVLSDYGNHKLKTLGKTEMKCVRGQHVEDVEFYVTDLKSPPVLGLKSSVKLKLVKRLDSVEKESLSKENVIKEYEDVFTGLGKMEKAYHIELKPEVEPVIHPARRIPFSLEEKLTETIDRLEKAEIVAKVNRPTDWVNSLVVAEKRDGSLRLCLDPKDLNKAIKREHFPMRTADDVSSRLSGKKVFTIVDEKDGYWQIPLDEESSYLCTFNTPKGRYRFLRMPFGISSASEVFQKRNEEIFGDMEGVEIIMDDIIISAVDEEENDRILRKVLDRAREKNIKFNPKKLQLKVREVKYVGNIVSEDGLRPDDEKIRAIIEMPVPESKEDLMRLLGMTNYLTKFVPNMSEKTAPLRMLLKKDAEWCWNHEHDKALGEVKAALTSHPVLQFFNVNEDVNLYTDASKGGLGACLFQADHPVAYASRSLSPAEENYAQIEKELLAVVFACEKFNQYVYGREVVVYSDHKPLETIIDKPLSRAPPRLQRMLLKLQKYHVVIKYMPGKKLVVADALSRAYLKDQPDPDPEMEVLVHSLVKSLPVTPERLDQLKQLTSEDEALQTLSRVIKDGWPDHKYNVPVMAKPFWDKRDEIHEAEGLLFAGERIIIPNEMRPTILGMIHEGHLGIEKCKNRARAVVYWPGMSANIEEVVSRCTICAKYRTKNAKEPILQHEIPDRPWQKIGVDLFEFKSKSYLAVVDYYSKYPEICQMKNKMAETVISHMMSIFSRHGIPETVMSDNMPFGSKEYVQFAKDYGFTIVTSSPRYPQSNGMIERTIQTIKLLLAKADDDGKDPHIALLEYRNTPVTGMTYSPAQLLMSRNLRAKLPVSSALLEPRVALDAKSQLLERQAQQSKYYNRGSKELPALKPGDSARIRQGKHWVPAVVTKEHAAPRSLEVATGDGGVYRRNRRDLLKTNESPPVIRNPVPEDFHELVPTVPEATALGSEHEQQQIVSPPSVPSPRRESLVEECPVPVIPPRRSSRVITKPARYRDY